MKLMTHRETQLIELLEQCKQGVRSAQKELYRRYFSYALTVCLHYSKSREEAEEILNDGFVKVFTRLGQFAHRSAFKSWLRQVMVRTAIDYHRKYHSKIKDWNIIRMSEAQSIENEALYNLSLDDALRLLQRLTPAYRMVFNLFVLEGYTHAEIAELLQINIGTSKSNLAKAKKKLQKLAAAYYEVKPKISNQ
ncbi:MAG: RNA polymerase sigma factor [Bacteroidota bacterium]